MVTPAAQHSPLTSMDKRKILIQLDSDALPSVFDRIVAIDAGAEEVFSYGGVKPEHGFSLPNSGYAMFVSWQ